jgi:hypothetical protein
MNTFQMNALTTIHISDGKSSASMTCACGSKLDEVVEDSFVSLPKLCAIESQPLLFERRQKLSSSISDDEWQLAVNPRPSKSHIDHKHASAFPT